MSAFLSLNLPQLQEAPEKAGQEHTEPLPSGGIDAEIAVLREGKHRRIEQLRSAKNEKARLDALENRLLAEISAIDLILGEVPVIEPAGSHQEVTEGARAGRSHQAEPANPPKRTRQSPGLAQSVDVVVELLRLEGPMHYRDIYDRVVGMGVTVIGKDPAATLLARFSRDKRIGRVGSGTYAIRQSTHNE